MFLRILICYNLCPDKISACPDNQKCCKHYSNYRCCPKENYCCLYGDFCCEYYSKSGSFLNLISSTSSIVLDKNESKNNLQRSNTINDEINEAELVILGSFLNVTELNK